MVPSVDRLSARRTLFIVLAAACLVTLPGIVVTLLRTSASEIAIAGEVEVGTVRTAANTPVSIHLMIGDVLDPSMTRNDLGFDLAALSLYFDPLRVDRQDLVVGNPLLFSALQRAASDSAQYRQLTGHILAALVRSSASIACLQRGETRTRCDGDKLQPVVFPSSSGGRVPWSVKYLGAVPLFDPTLVEPWANAEDYRRRLAVNLRVATRRLIDVASDSLGRGLHSIGFAALGSTSQRGGDSPSFLSFSEGFGIIVRAVAESRPSPTLDRVYLVAYDRHTGAFRDDAMAALEAVSSQLALRRITTGPAAYLMGLALMVLYTLLSVASYQNAPRILTDQNRFVFVGSVLTVTSVVALSGWGAVCAAANEDLLPYGASPLTIHGLLFGLLVVFALWLTKRGSRRSQSAAELLRALRRHS